jgi:phosphoglycolate phosphatase-like HAD superfamily hydrolase
MIDLLGQSASIDEQMFSTGAFKGPVEFQPGFVAYPDITHVLFDFDGTLSWLRHGWPQIMCGLFCEWVTPVRGQSRDSLESELLEGILSLNGKPTIYQMQYGAELARERAGRQVEPAKLLAEYQRRLEAAIDERCQSIARGQAHADDFVVHGGRRLLEWLKRRGWSLIILSGTVELSVKKEAELLGLSSYFGEHIYGSRADLGQWSKGEVLARLLKEEKIEGRHLLSFGDGPVEIRLTKEAGGLAVGVASDEEVNGSGRLDLHKKKQLLAAGSDVLIPDYRDADRLMEELLGVRRGAESTS